MIFMMPTNVWQIVIIIYLKNNDKMDSMNLEKAHKPKSSTKQLEFHVAAVYEEISTILQEAPDLQIQMPTDVPTAVERVNLIKATLVRLIKGAGQGNTSIPKTADQENIFSCSDCETYEKNLQKLEGEVRNHIRTHQQLRLYQDGLEQKIQEMKKDKREGDKKAESTKKKYEEMKLVFNANLEKIAKLESENDRLKEEAKESRNLGKADEGKRLMRYESNKENLSDWRNNQPHKTERERGSVEKRAGSSERLRVSVNVRSTKGIPISSKIIQEKTMSSKIVHEKTKEEKAKALKNRIGFGY